MNWKQGGLIETIIPPFSIIPASQLKMHTELLLPYMTKREFSPKTADRKLEEWITYSTIAADQSVAYADTTIELMNKQIEKWYSLCGTAKQDTTVNRLIEVLPSAPIISIDYASKLTGRKHNATSQAVQQLKEAGILKSFAHGKRNRLFIAEAYTDLLKDLLHQLIPRKPRPQDDFFTVKDKGR